MLPLDAPPLIAIRDELETKSLLVPSMGLSFLITTPQIDFVTLVDGICSPTSFFIEGVCVCADLSAIFLGDKFQVRAWSKAKFVEYETLMTMVSRA